MLSADIFKITVTKKIVEEKLNYIKRCVQNGNFYFLKDRDKNRDFLVEWIIDIEACITIIINLTAEDFSYVDFDRDSDKRNEPVYVFGKNVNLMPRFAFENNEYTQVNIYIKIKCVDEKPVVVISFHEAEHELVFPFK